MLQYPKKGDFNFTATVFMMFCNGLAQCMTLPWPYHDPDRTFYEYLECC